MAMNFIKKVFSFGKKPAEEKPENKPEETPSEAIPASAIPDAAPPAEHENVPSGDTGHFPHDGEMQFTPETAAEPDLDTAPPSDETHAGETPPVDDEAVEEPDKVAELKADPAIEAAEETEAFATSDKPAEEPVVATPPPVEPETEEPPLSEPAADLEEAMDTLDAAIEEVEAAVDAVVDEVVEEQANAEPVTETATPTPPPAGYSGSRQVRIGRELTDAGADEPVAPETGPEPTSWWQRLRAGLSRSSSQLSNQVTGIFTRRKLDEDTLQDLEDVLIQADLGVETALRITDSLSAGRYGRDVSSKEVAQVMASEIEKVLTPVARPLELDLSHKPHVILVVGVNGTGKTTTIGKLAAKLTAGGLKVTLAAGDTFRAAAIEQLKIWGERTRSEVVATKLGADAAGLAYEAIERARENNSDVVIIDTAGRLQNKAELMDELAKVVRVIGKLDPDAPHTVLQTLDATTGQNALNQVEIFRNIAGVNGLVMTKLDGTARGGILVAIAAKHKLPVYFIGVGEGVDDLEPFEAKDFAQAIVGDTE
jgi:fused signal recognition particle receptor